MRRYTKPTLEQFKNFGIYKNMGLGEVMNRLAVLKSCQFESLVDNGPHLYEKSRSILGGAFTDRFIMNTIGNMFVAGSSSEDLKSTIEKLNSKGLGAVVYYVAEALEGRPFEEHVGDHDHRNLTTLLQNTSKL